MIWRGVGVRGWERLTSQVLGWNLYMLTFRGLRARVAGSAINHRAQRCRHSLCDGVPAPRNDIELIDFDATDERVVHYRCKRNHELAARIRRLRELLYVGDVLPTSGFY